jgi:hypothetical protein
MVVQLALTFSANVAGFGLFGGRTVFRTVSFNARHK